MSSSTSSTASNRQFSLAPYVVPPIAASASIVFVFRDLIAKSEQQKGQPVARLTVAEGLRAGLKSAPTIGVIVGSQMALFGAIKMALTGDANNVSLSTALASAAVVGGVSSPILAIFNGQTMGWSVRESFRKFSPSQCAIIAVQETAFVGGVGASDAMKGWFGGNKAIEYSAAFTAGVLSGLIGHPANTALTRWQSGMVIDNIRQLTWGAPRRMRALGLFSVLYKFGKETLNPDVENAK